MNTMLTSVMERTREIGIMKAIGATNKDIMSIFIIEGMLVSSIGGIIGIILGVFGSQGLTMILNNFMADGWLVKPYPSYHPYVGGSCCVCIPYRWCSFKSVSRMESCSDESDRSSSLRIIIFFLEGRYINIPYLMPFQL